MKDKKKKVSRGINVNWITIFIVISIIIIMFGFIYVIDSLKSQRLTSKIIQAQIDALKSNSAPTSVDSLYIEYYRELSDKTDEAINRVLVIVGIIAGIVTLFSTLFAFKAPRDIDKRIDELKGELVAAKEAADEAKYQAEIANALTESDPQSKVAKLSDVINKYPNKHDGYVYRSLARLNKKQFEKAITDLNISLNLGLEDYEYYNILGLIYIDKEEYDNAIISLSKAIEINPESYAPYNNRAIAYLSIDKYEESLSDLKKALFLYPENLTALLNRHSIYLSLILMEEDTDKKAQLQSLADADYAKIKELGSENELFNISK